MRTDLPICLRWQGRSSSLQDGSPVESGVLAVPVSDERPNVPDKRLALRCLAADLETRGRKNRS
ncbi:MAG TPA: hypothetical protein VMK12_23940 [Anaeromyxobacteraceae bacterium]|nr:hypothetical protein [Anaeromyxobacteraceae bacterium]